MTSKILLLFFTPLIAGLLIYLVPKGRNTNFKLLLVFAGSYLFSITVIHILPELYHQTAGADPARGAGEELRLQLRHLGDDARADAVEDIGVAAEDAGGAAWRVEQDSVGLESRLPFEQVGGDDLGG